MLSARKGSLIKKNNAGVEGTNFGLLQRTRSGQPWGEQRIDKDLEKGRSLGVQGTKGCPLAIARWGVGVRAGAEWGRVA